MVVFAEEPCLLPTGSAQLGDDPQLGGSHRPLPDQRDHRPFGSTELRDHHLWVVPSVGGHHRRSRSWQAVVVGVASQARLVLGREVPNGRLEGLA